MYSKTYKKVPWAGWSKQAPFGAARTRMYKNGKNVFRKKNTR